MSSGSGPGPESRGGLAGSAALMFSGTLVSRLLGLIKTVLLVAAIGVTGAANSFAVANKLPNVIYMLVAGGVLNAILVPQIVRAMRSADRGAAYVNRLLTMAGAALLGLTVLLTAGSVVLVTIYASELDPRWFALAVTFALWCVPQLFFYGMYTLLGQVLNARGIFGPYMWAPAANNVVAIVGLLAYLVVFGSTATGAHLDPSAWGTGRIALLAGSATLGVAVQACVLAVPLRRSGFRFRLSWGLRGSGLGRASNVAMWAFGMVLVSQLGFIAISNVAAAASSAAAGPEFIPGNAAWENATYLYILPQSLITVSLVTVLFTRVSSDAARGNLESVRSDLSLGLRTIGVFTVFIGGALAVLALPLVQAVLPTTTVSEAQGIARIVVSLLLGISALGMLTMVQRVYYAFEDARSLFFLQIPLTLLVVVGVLLSRFLPATWWMVGAGLATALSNIVGAVVAYLGLRRKLPSLDGACVLRTHVRLVVAATPAVLVGWLLLHLIGPATTATSLVPRLTGALGRVLVVGLVMSALYLIALRLLRVSELDVLLRPVGRGLNAVARRVPGGALLGRVGRHLASSGTRTMNGAPTTSRVSGGGDLDEHEAADLIRGTVLAGRYRLEESRTTHLAGAQAWHAVDDILDRPVMALLLPAGSPTTADTLDAARRAALVNDHRLRRILAVGQHDGRGYIVTEESSGTDLAALISAGPTAPDQARAIIGEAAGAVEAASVQGVHHLALGVHSITLHPDGHIVLNGVGLDAAHQGLPDADPLGGARTDTVALVRLLDALLTGVMPQEQGTPSDFPDDSDAPAELIELCRETLYADGGPRNPRDLIRALAPWPDLDASLAVTALAHAAAETAGTPDDPAGENAAEDEDSPPETAGAPVTAPAAAQPSLDPSDWQPRTPAERLAPAPGFETVLTPAAGAATLPFTAHHGRGSVSTAVTAAALGGVAVLAGQALRRAGRAVASLPQAWQARRAERAEAAAETERLKARDVEIATAQEDAVPEDAHPDAAPVVTDPAVAAAAYPGATVPLPEAHDPEAAHHEEPSYLQEQEPQPAGPAAHDPEDPFPPMPGSEPELAVSRRFDPTPVVLAIFALAVLIVSVLAFRTLTADPGPRTPTAPTTTEAPSEPEGSEAEEADAEEPEEPTEAEPTEEPEVTASPVIGSLTPLDPEGDGAENPDLTPQALDGDRSTYWRSRSYVDPQYGMKTGIGLSVVFEEESLLTEVVIDLMGEGGMVEIRDTTADDPTGGTLLAEGEMGPDSSFEIDGVVTEEIVLWFTRLPVADSDGRNRLEIAELEVD